MKITNVLVVDAIESAFPFWIDRLGFTKVVEVPEGDALGFVILTNGGAEIMLQSAESVRKDTSGFVPHLPSGGFALFIEVDDFTATLQRLAGYPVTLPERVTSYGMREIGVHAPGGHPVMFAARA